MERIRRLTAFTVWLACLAVLAIFDRCTFKKPVTPSWDVRFELPLIDSTYTMQELADHSPNQMTTDPLNHNVILRIDKGPESFAVGEYLTAAAITNPNQFDFSGLGTVGSNRTVNDTLEMENTILVQNAVFEKGTVEFEFINQTGFTMDFQSTVFSLKRNGQPIQVRFFGVSPGTSRQSVDLADVTFEPLVSNDHKNLVPYAGSMSIVGGGSNGISIVAVNVKLKGVVYRSVTGWLNRTEVAIDTTVETGIKVSDELRGIQIGSALLQMTLVNDVRFPADFDLTLTGYAEDGRSETIQIPPQSVGASESVATNSVDVAKIANLLPKTLRLRGRALIGSGFTGSPATIRKDDLVKASIHFEAPLIFTLPPATNTSSVDTIDIKEDAREKIQKNALYAKLVFEIDNAVPLGAAISFFFSKSRSDTLLYKNADLVKNISLDPSSTRIDPTNPNVRIVSQPSTNSVTLELSKADLKVFESPKVFWQRRLTFPGTVGMVKVRPEDYIRVRARIEATINTDFEKDEKEKGGGS
jgi:hypothetical protein